MSFRKNLEHLRKSAKLSQEDFAYKLGVSRQAVSKWESGSAYPETEKILKMCDIFNCSLDELMKDDIAQIRSEQSKRYSFSDMLDGFNSLLAGTFKHFESLTPKGRFRFLFEIFILFILILLVKIPFGSLDSLGADIFLSLGRSVGVVLANIWHLVVEVAYFIVALGLFVYIYKVRFLDRFDEVVQKRKAEDIEIDEENDGEVDSERVVKETKVIRYDFGILSFVGKIFLFFVKIFVIFTLLPFLFLFFCSGIGLSFLIVLLFNGVVYVGPILLAIAFIVFVVVLLYVGFNFVLSRRNKWTQVFIVFIASILGLAFGVGISSFELSKMKFVEDLPEGIDVATEVVDFKMNDRLFFNLVGHVNSYEYEVDEELKDTVKVKIKYASKYNSVRFENVEGGQWNDVYLYVDSRNSNDVNGFRDMFFEDLKNHTLRNYTKLFYGDVVIVSSKENVERLRYCNSFSGYFSDGVYYGGNCRYREE